MSQSRLPWLRGVLTAACLVPITQSGVAGPPLRLGRAGSFEATLSGARSGRVSGKAMFYLFGGASGGGPARIVLYDYREDGDMFVIQFQFAAGGIPGGGAFPLSAYGGEGFWVAASAIRPNEAWMLANARGTLTLTTASDERLAGTFSFTDASDPDAAVTIAGTFDAPRGAAEDIPQAVR